MMVAETFDPGGGGSALMAADGPLPADLLFDPGSVPSDLATVAGRLLHLDRELSMPALPQHLLWMHLTTAGTGEALTVRARGDQSPGLHETAPAGLTVLTAGTETLWRYHGLAEALCWLVPTEDFEAEAAAHDLDPDRLELVSCVGEPNALIHALAWATLRECRREERSTSLYLEAMRTSMIAEVMRVRASHSPALRAHKVGATRIRSVVDYVEANLGTDLRLTSIARAVGISPHQLARGFRREMGLPLHRYVLRQRTTVGRALLVRTDAPIAEVATEVGFSDQSHFTHWVRRLYGVTPSRLRADADPGAVRRVSAHHDRAGAPDH